MKPTTRWERFKRNFIWGTWPWRDPATGRLQVWADWGDFAAVTVVGKLKVYIPPLRRRSRHV